MEAEKTHGLKPARQKLMEYRFVGSYQSLMVQKPPQLRKSQTGDQEGCNTGAIIPLEVSLTREHQY